MAKITKLYAANAAKNPDNVLEQAVGKYQSVLIAGYDKNGEVDVRASTDLTREALLWLCEKAKEQILHLSQKED